MMKNLKVFLMIIILGQSCMQNNINASFESYLPSSKREKTFTFLGMFLGAVGLYAFINIYEGINGLRRLNLATKNAQVRWNKKILDKINATIESVEQQQEKLNNFLKKQRENTELKDKIMGKRSDFYESLFLLKNTQSFINEIYEKKIEFNWSTNDINTLKNSFEESLQAIQNSCFNLNEFFKKIDTINDPTTENNLYRNIFHPHISKLTVIDLKSIQKFYLTKLPPKKQCSFKLYWRNEKDPFTVNVIKQYALNTKNKEKNDDNDLYIVADQDFIHAVATSINSPKLGYPFMLENRGIKSERIWSRGGGIYKFSDICDQSFKLTNEKLGLSVE